MARVTYGKTFRTRKGRLGRYKYINGRKVGFVGVKKSFRSSKRRWNK